MRLSFAVIVSVIAALANTGGSVALGAKALGADAQAVRGGSNSYCLETMACGGPVKGCTSSIFGDQMCDPEQMPSDCSGAPQNECNTTPVHNACNSTVSSNPSCTKGTSHLCGLAYKCTCQKDYQNDYKCKRALGEEPTTCGHYEEASPPCYP